MPGCSIVRARAINGKSKSPTHSTDGLVANPSPRATKRLAMDNNILVRNRSISVARFYRAATVHALLGNYYEQPFAQGCSAGADVSPVLAAVRIPTSPTPASLDC